MRKIRIVRKGGTLAIEKVGSDLFRITFGKVDNRKIIHIKLSSYLHLCRAVSGLLEVMGHEPEATVSDVMSDSYFHMVTEGDPDDKETRIGVHVRDKHHKDLTPKAQWTFNTVCKLNELLSQLNYSLNLDPWGISER